jgi:hypothetical protein
MQANVRIKPGSMQYIEKYNRGKPQPSIETQELQNIGK